MLIGLSILLIVADVFLFLLYRWIHIPVIMIYIAFFLVGILYGYLLANLGEPLIANSLILIVICGWLNLQLIYVMRRYYKYEIT